MKKISLFLITLFAITHSAFATHVPGGNITYQCLGPNTYIVTLTLFEDCGTAFETSNPEPITITNDCGYSSVNIGGVTQQIGNNSPVYFLNYFTKITSIIKVLIPFRLEYEKLH